MPSFQQDSGRPLSTGGNVSQLHNRNSSTDRWNKLEIQSLYQSLGIPSETGLCAKRPLSEHYLKAEYGGRTYCSKTSHLFLSSSGLLPRSHNFFEKVIADAEEEK